MDGLARASGVRWRGGALRRALSGGKKRAWATEYDVEKTSGRTYLLDWTEEGRCC